MIQPINALTPRATHRGNGKTYEKVNRGISNPEAALLNAGGVTAAAGGIATVISRAYTKSWPQAMVLGMFGSALTLFFMTPHLIEKFAQSKPVKGNSAEAIAKSEAQKISNIIKEHTAPMRKLIPFKADKV